MGGNRAPLTARAHLWRWTALGLGCLALLAAIVGARLFFQSMGALGESDDTPTLSQIETYTGVRIPPGARDLKARLELIITKRTLIARFTIEPAELSALLSNSPFKELLSSQDKPVLLDIPDAPPWWTPQKAVSFLTATSTTRRAAILVDTARTASTGRYVVYLIARS